MEVKIWMRKQQRYSKSQQPVTYNGLNPQSIITTPGSISNNSWIDYTHDIAGLDKLKLIWTETLDDNNNQTTVNNNRKKSATSTLQFERSAYLAVKEWLVDDVAAPLNAMELKVEFVGCATFEDWSIEYQQITWCENGLCTYELTLKQKNPLFHCIQNTIINDNWQGWFPDDGKPANGKKHPRFSYCNEIRPNAMLIMQWWMTGVVAGSTIMVMIPLVLAINSILFAINGIIAIINAIASILGSGTSTTVNYIQFIDPFDIIKSYTQYYIESAGCGREHPAVLIRDYISNVCDKCGVKVDQTSFPLFFAQMYTYDSSSAQPYTSENDYYNACVLYAPNSRGIRRFYNINIINGPQPNNVDFWIQGNAPDIALSDFLDKLGLHFNHEWRLRNGWLEFQRTDFFKNTTAIYNFQAGAPDRAKLIDGICYEFNKVIYPAYVDGLYPQDPADSCGNEARPQINGKAITFMQYEDQPNFGGKLELTSPFGPAKFRLDGSSTDYIFDAMQVVLNGQILQPWTFGQMQTVASWLSTYADYGLLLRDETCSLPKILIWDGESYENAKCVKNKCAYPGISTEPIPDINLNYNNSAQGGVKKWNEEHDPKTFVIGSGLTFPASPPGRYRVEDYFGNQVTEKQAMIVNYPMYFEPKFRENLWDRFFWIRDPRKNPYLNRSFSLKIPLCCDDVEKLGIKNDGANAQLGQKILLDASQFYKDGKIIEITASVDPSDRVGAYLEIKGIA